jgi:hypothetical protein
MNPQHAFLAVVLACPLAAQAASGTSTVLVCGELGAGGSTQSAVHRLTGTFSSGVPATRAASPGFVLLGGFPAAIEAPAGGRPWLTGVRPALAPLLGGTALTLHGTGLDVGPLPQVAIGGQPAVAGARTSATLQTVLPRQPRPGYRPVDLQNSSGSSTLPAGLGVLPLLDFPVAHQANVPLALRYRGAQGDQMVLVLALGTLPVPLALPPFHHGLELDLFTLTVLPALPVAGADGALLLPLPAVAPPVPVHLQAFSFTQDPGWAPGSFTNAVRL